MRCLRRRNYNIFVREIILREQVPLGSICVEFRLVRTLIETNYYS